MIGDYTLSIERKNEYASAGPSIMAHPWHTFSVVDVLRRLGVTLEGLSSARAAKILEQTGSNQLHERPHAGLLAMLLNQFRDVMIAVLLAAAVVSGLLGEFTDTLVILLIVFMNAVIGVVQEYRAERAIAALKALSIPITNVLRNGQVISIASTEVVPGDLLYLEAGNLVCADIRLTECIGLQVDESALTGESNPVMKQTDAIGQVDIPLGDRNNLLFRGTQITHGRGAGLVVATGMQTEIGRIARLLDSSHRPLTPLQQRLARFGRVLAIAVLAICAVVFLFGLLRGEPTLLMFLTAVSLAVAAVPEALPAVVAISLALGAKFMIRHQALIRQLPAVETLGSVTYICTDKTGTLTRNRMRLEKLMFSNRIYSRKDDLDGRVAEQVLKILLLNNDAQLDSEGKIQGDPTEVALFKFARHAGYEPELVRAAAPRISELPFDAERRMMTTLHEVDSGIDAYTKGAPEHVIQCCVSMLTDEGSQPIDRPYLNQQAINLAQSGFRVLALAARKWPAAPEPPSAGMLERELEFIGLVALIDPPHRKVKRAVKRCISAGIVPVMMTGDHPATARAIARRLAIVDGDDRILTGVELEALTDQAFSEIVSKVRVYARVAPEQKIRIVTALQNNGEFVAMTGDGVNDAPALKQANIGIAMGMNGTDVAREASHMVLLDDNFSTIVAAVEEGRRIFDNIRKFIRYTMTSNSGEIWTLFLAPFFGMPLPLLPVHILWINLVTDGLPGLALAAEKKERDLMQRPPRLPDESILSGGMPWHILFIGLLIGALSLGTQAVALYQDNPHWQTMVFTVLTFTQLCHVMVIRSGKQSLFTSGIWANPALMGSLALTIALQIAIIYTPLTQTLFKLQPLTGMELLYCILVSSVVIPAVEVEKLLIRRGLIYRKPALKKQTAV